jgi:signal transduction histidine kinase
VKELLPSGLRSVADPSRAITLRLVDPEGRVVGPGPTVPSGGTLRRPLAPDLPLPGWSVDVALDPEAVRPLLPYGGRDAPWTALALLGALALGSAVFAIRSLGREIELVRVRQDFIANVSHELKTPLARIRLFNELLERPTDDERRRARYRKVIDRECRRLTYLVDNVLDFSRHERGMEPPLIEPLDLRGLAEEALDSFRTGHDARRFSLQGDLEPTTILGSRIGLSQVLINLLDNAVKYSPEGSPVDVTLEGEAGFVALRVADRGPGIPIGQRDRIFEDFYRIDSGDAQRVAGTGLGLSVVRRTVAAHGGRVSVEDRPGGGSVFNVRLPQARPSAAPAQTAATP